MAPQCTFTLLNGRKCRCAATRNQKFCRHHAPQRIPSSASRRTDRPLSRIRRWGGLKRTIPSIDPTDIPFEAYNILDALLRDGVIGISDREAGRLLRGLLRRHGSVPFPFPDEPADPPATAAPPAQPQRPMRAPQDSVRIKALMAKIGPGVIDQISEEDLLKAWSEITGTST